MAYNSNDQRTLPGVLQGVTSQNAGNNIGNGGSVSGSQSVSNSSSVVAPGQPNPQDARAGYLAVAQPGGANNAIIANADGSGASGTNLQHVASPAGTAGGGGIYPGPINPMVSPGWTVQANANEDSQSNDSLAIAGTLSVAAAHTSSISSAPTITGGTGPYSVQTVEVNGAATSVLPAGFALTATTGVIAYTASGNSAGTYTFVMKVVDSSTPALSRYFTEQFVLS